VGDAEHVQVFELRQRRMVIDRVGNGGIVVAGQEHHRQRRRGDDLGGAIEQSRRQAVAIEGVAGEHHSVGTEMARGLKHAGEPGGAVAAMQPRGVVVIEVEIGAMDDREVAGGRRHCRGHGRRTYLLASRWQSTPGADSGPLPHLRLTYRPPLCGTTILPRGPGTRTTWGS
jgi:hypothetical protein